MNPRNQHFAPQLSSRQACGAVGTLGIVLDGLEPARHRRRREPTSTASTPLAGGIITNTGGISNGDFKALVCIFLYGGNDSNNLLVPYRQRPFTRCYATARGGLALSQNTLLPITAEDQRRTHLRVTPQPARTAHPFRQRARSALMANVGTLVAPVTRNDIPQQFRRNSRRSSFSHADQQTTVADELARQPRRAPVGAGAWPTCSTRSTPPPKVSMNISSRGHEHL